MKTIKDLAGQPMDFDDVAAREKVIDFLNDRYPANMGKHKESTIKRGIKALERQARDVEIGALAREFA